MIICCRNPKDALVSFYHHYRNNKKRPFTGSFDLFFTLYVAGLVENNSYFEYYRKYWDFYKRNLVTKQVDIYWLNYEDLIKDEESKRKEIRKLITFIGVQDVVYRKEDIDRIVERTSMGNMKKQYEGGFPISNFVRSGKVGEWKQYLSAEQSEIMDTLIRLHFSGTDFKYYRDLCEQSEYLCRSKL